MEKLDLEEIVAKMRALGVTRYRDGVIEVELGDLPHAAQAVDPREAALKAEEALRSETKRKMRTLFGAVSSKPKQ